MSYYKPSFNQTAAMSRGGRGFSSRGPSSYRGNSRGNSWGGGSRGGYGGSRGGRFNSFSSSMDRNKFNNDKYGGGRHDDFRKPYRNDSYGGPRDRSPDRKRLRTGSSHDRSFGASSDYSRGYEPERRSFSGDRRPAPFMRREEFRKPHLPSNAMRGSYRGRLSSRGSARARLRDRPTFRRRLVDTSYSVRKRFNNDYARRLKLSKLRSTIVRRKKDGSDKEDEEEEEESDNEEIEEKKEDEEGNEGEASENEEVGEDGEKKSPKKDKDEGTKSDKEDGNEAEKEAKSPNRQYIKLVCPQCSIRCPKFNQYSLHLQSGRHASAMRRVAMKQKAILSQMRLVQRKAQRELEETTDDLALRTSWCPLCKLNYKQPKFTHQSSQAHKDMKKFLMPFCHTCGISFKSPMSYESHCCSIEHIKRKASRGGDKEDGSEDLENFMTIDSVGDMDEEGDSTEKKEGETIEKKEKISVGIENVRKVEVYYCDLCRMYLPRVTEEEEVAKMLSRHCKIRSHLQRYIRYKEDRELAKRAERLQRKETAEKEKEKVDVKVEEEVEKESDDKTEDKEDATGEHDKMWADVDKDLGDILAEAANKSSDEEEEDSAANAERFDRFKLSEKNGEESKENKDEDKKEVDDAKEK